jgi:dimethylglycine dehydrogenase
MDFTGFAKYEIHGPDARAYLNRLCANRIPSKQGGITLTHVLSDQGRIQGEMTITCIAADCYYVLSAASAETRDMDHLLQGLQANEQVSIQNVTDDWGLLVVAGPQARDLLSTCSTADFSTEAFRWFTGQAITIAGVPVRALRMNYVGELGWELHAPIAQLTTVYDALWHAGQPFGIANFGLYAVNSLRIEKGYRGWGAELTNEVTLLDADMERFIRFDKKPDFNGRAATLAQRDTGRSIQLVYLTVQAGTSDVRGGEPVYSDGHCIGVTTSGGYGHRTDQSLGFGYVAIAYSAPGTIFEVEILGERYPATVLAEPVWDPSNARQRA